jgi:Tol biopolymer transport system component
MRTRATSVFFAIGLVGAITAGVVSAASGPAGRIVFDSQLPAYPLPDNFQQSQLFSISISGRGKREINPGPLWTWSRDESQIYFTRDTPAGAELWAERGDGTQRRRLALLSGSGHVIDVAWSPDYSKLDIVADSLWVVGADGSQPHAVFTPPGAAPMSSIAWSHDGSRLTLVAGDLWSVAADGSGIRRVFAALPGHPIGSYRVSPDGSAFVVGAEDTWLVPPGQGQPVKLASDELDTVNWAPGGKAFALELVSIAGCGSGSTKCAEWYLLMFDLTGKQIGRDDDARDGAWSPDASRIVFEAGPLAVAPEEGTIEVAKVDGTRRRVLSRNLSKGDDSCWRYPAWRGNARVSFEEGGCDPDGYEASSRTVVVDSITGRLISSVAGADEVPSPGGKRLLYLRPRGDDVVLYAARATGQTPVRLSPTHGIVDEAAWSPDSRFVAFTYGVQNGEQIYIVPSQGGRPRLVTHEPAPSWESGLSWSSNGRRLFYFSLLDRLNHNALWTVAPDGSSPRRLTRDSTDDYNPAWSPDGRQVAFARGVRNGSEIDVVNADGTGEHRIVGKPQEADAQPEWSPDGKRIAFIREAKGTYWITIANADGSHVHVLGNASSVYGRPAWSPDGSEIVYSDSGTTIVAVAPDGTRKRDLIHTVCGSPTCTWFTDVAFSPDGTQIAVICAYCDPSTPAGIWVMRADGSGLRLIVATPGSRPSWSADGRSIAFAGPCGPPPASGTDPSTQVCVVGVDGSNLRPLTPPQFTGVDPNWSRH